MRLRKTNVIFCIFSAAILLLTGCVANTSNTIKRTSISDMPDWVSNGSGAYAKRDERVLFGVGVAKGIKSRAISRTVADNRSREEVEKLLDRYLKILISSYKNYGSVSEEITFKQAIEKVSKQSLSRAKIVSHWIDSKKGTFYSLCRLDLNNITELIDQEEIIDPEIRDFAVQYEEELHQKMVK